MPSRSATEFKPVNSMLKFPDVASTETATISASEKLEGAAVLRPSFNFDQSKSAIESETSNFVPLLSTSISKISVEVSYSTPVITIGGAALEIGIAVTIPGT